MNKSNTFSFKQILDDAKQALTKSESSSLSAQIKERNKELQQMLASYEEKFKLDEKEFRLNELEETSQLQEDHIKSLTVDSLQKSKLLDSREADFHKQLLDFEKQKVLLESQKAIIKNQIIHLEDVRLKKVLAALDDRFDEVHQAESLLSEKEAVLRNREDAISKREENYKTDANLKQQELLQLEQDIHTTLSRRSDLDGEIRGLLQKKNELDLVVKERSSLIQRLTKQYAESKDEFQRARDATKEEQGILNRTREEIQLEKQQFDQEKEDFSKEKRAFIIQSKSFTEKNALEAENYKKKILTEVQSQIDLAEEKVDELQSKELMLKKLEQELLNREEKLSAELEDVSKRSRMVKDREDTVKKQLDSVTSQKEDLESYENEVSQLEQTVLDLKKVIESKEHEFADRLGSLESREEAIIRKSKELDEHIMHFKDLLQDAGFEKTFQSVLKTVKKAVDSNNIDKAKEEYKKACAYYRYLPKRSRLHFAATLKNLHGRIGSSK